MAKPDRSGTFKGHRFPPDIISFAVWACHRLVLRLRDVEELLAERGIEVDHFKLEQIANRVAVLGAIQTTNMYANGWPNLEGPLRCV